MDMQTILILATSISVLALATVSICFFVYSRRMQNKITDMQISAAKHTKALEEQSRNARIASQAKSDFLSRMSHEIRTPLNAIIGMTHVARRTDDTHKMRYYLANVEASSGHLLEIVNEILDFSKLESGKMDLEEKLFSLRKSITFITDMFQSLAEEKGLKLITQIVKLEHDGIITDSLRLNQVLINLLSNALKFTNIGEIRLVVEELLFDGSEAVYRFSVIDTGIGIDPSQAGKLFTSFTQVGTDTSRLFGGTGLGLAISKDLVAFLGGEIDLDTTPGKGSTFSFTIRVKAQAEAISPVGEKTLSVKDLHLDGKNILVVDDFEVNREIIIALLEGSGANIENAENGKIALDAFISSSIGHFDMILMDLQMPIMDGLISTHEIRSMERADADSVFIMAVSAFAMQEDIDRALAAGMDDYLIKPIDVNTMYKKIGGWFENAS